MGICLILIYFNNYFKSKISEPRQAVEKAQGETG